MNGPIPYIHQIDMAFRAHLTVSDLEELRTGYREDRERHCALFVDCRFTFTCDDGEKIRGIISKVTVSDMVDGVSIEFLTPEKVTQPRRLFHDYMRESQGTSDFDRWFISSGNGDKGKSKPGYLALGSKWNW